MSVERDPYGGAHGGGKAQGGNDESRPEQRQMRRGGKARGLRIGRTRAEDEDRNEERQCEEGKEHPAAARAERERAARRTQQREHGRAQRERAGEDGERVRGEAVWQREERREHGQRQAPPPPMRRDLARDPAAHRMRRERHLVERAV